MLINVIGDRCYNCAKYTQYYANRLYQMGTDMQPIDCGFCGQLQRNTRPGNRCKYFREVSNIAAMFVPQGKDPGYKTKEDTK